MEHGEVGDCWPQQAIIISKLIWGSQNGWAYARVFPIVVFWPMDGDEAWNLMGSTITVIGAAKMTTNHTYE